jgi:hypothetical protein
MGDAILRLWQRGEGTGPLVEPVGRSHFATGPELLHAGGEPAGPPAPDPTDDPADGSATYGTSGAHFPPLLGGEWEDAGPVSLLSLLRSPPLLEPGAPCDPDAAGDAQESAPVAEGGGPAAPPEREDGVAGSPAAGDPTAHGGVAPPADAPGRGVAIRAPDDPDAATPPRTSDTAAEADLRPRADDARPSTDPGRVPDSEALPSAPAAAATGRTGDGAQGSTSATRSGIETASPPAGGKAPQAAPDALRETTSDGELEPAGSVEPPPVRGPLPAVHAEARRPDSDGEGVGGGRGEAMPLPGSASVAPVESGSVPDTPP